MSGLRDLPVHVRGTGSWGISDGRRGSNLHVGDAGGSCRGYPLCFFKTKGDLMKKFGIFATLLCLGLVMIGCGEKSAPTTPATPPAEEGAAPAEGGAPAEDAGGGGAGESN